jgi:hypothetical protein
MTQTFYAHINKQKKKKKKLVLKSRGGEKGGFATSHNS